MIFLSSFSELVWNLRVSFFEVRRVLFCLEFFKRNNGFDVGLLDNSELMGLSPIRVFRRYKSEMSGKSRAFETGCRRQSEASNLGRGFQPKWGLPTPRKLCRPAALQIEGRALSVLDFCGTSPLIPCRGTLF